MKTPIIFNSIGGTDGHKRFNVDTDESPSRLTCECGWSTSLGANSFADARAQLAAHIDLARLGVR